MFTRQNWASFIHNFYFILHTLDTLNFSLNLKVTLLKKKFQHPPIYQEIRFEFKIGTG